MKTLEQIYDWVKNERYDLGMIADNRDLHRLAYFIPTEDLGKIGLGLQDGQTHTPNDFTRENVVAQLKDDVAFGFEKALNQRGISAGLMYEVVKMWMWILEDDLADFDDYAMYGLPLFKAVALKYGFDNPIGNDTGGEDKYNE